MSLLHFDEIAYLKYNHIVVPTAVNAMIAAAAQARKMGLPAPIIYTTTAGNPDTKEGNYALSILEDAMPFTEALYDLPNRSALLELIKKHSLHNTMLYLEFSYHQLGKTDEWFYETAARSKASQDDINRDLLNIWQSSSTKAILPQEIRTQLRNSKREPAYVDYSDGFVVRWYVDRDVFKRPDFKQRSMILGMDTSENIGRDFTTFTIIDPTDMQVMATSRCNESNIMQVARHMVTLLKRYPKLVFIPERNNTGTGIIDFVMEQLQSDNINPFTRIYNEVVQNREDPKYEKINIYNYKEIYGHTRAAFGYRTSGGAIGGTSRNQLYKVTMMKTLEMNAARIFDATLINEFCSLTERNGRIDHPEGLHDDQCFVAGTLVRTPSGNVPIETLKEGDLVLTRKGYKPILHVYVSKKEVISKFGLTGTANHPFITPKGIVKFADLKLWSKVYVWLPKQSRVAMSSIRDILIQRNVNVATHCTKQQALVYNLLVADCHEYFVNDILVHNCISYLLACFLVFFGKHLETYGIPQNTILSAVTTTGDPVDAALRQQQIQIQQRVHEIEDQLAANPAYILRQSLLRELDNLKPLIDEKIVTIEPLAVSQVKDQERNLQGNAQKLEDRVTNFTQRWVNAINRY